MLTGLIPQNEVQSDLFGSNRYSDKDHSLMKSMDRLNSRFGKETVVSASSGLIRDWAMKQQYLSKRYTTRWEDLMIVKL